MTPAFAIVVALIALAIGALVGWLLGRQPLAEWRQRFAARDAEARETDARYLRAFADLEAARERAGRVDVLAVELAEAAGGSGDAGG